MSTLREKVIALFADEETPPVEPATPLGYLPGQAPPVVPAGVANLPVTPEAVTPPVTPPPVTPPATPPATPPGKSIQETIDEALRIQKAEMEAGFKEKLKGITSNTTPPPAVAPPPEPPAEGVDFKKWNQKVSEISKRIANQN